MSVFPSLPTGGIPVIDIEPNEPAPIVPGDTAIDGSPASRPGDPSPPPASDDEPLFSTDPLR